MSVYFPVTLAASLLTTHHAVRLPGSLGLVTFFGPDYKSYTLANLFRKVSYNHSLPGRI